MKKQLLIIVIMLVLITVGLIGCIQDSENKIPQASFSVKKMIYVGDEVEFIDNSSDENGTVVAWIWNFGDGNTSELQNPTYIYLRVDSYNVTLIVTDNDGQKSEPYTIKIDILPLNPVASFSYSPAENITTTTEIQFNDTSTTCDTVYACAIVEWLWYFGDGNLSNINNPKHTYANPGSYSVKLEVTNGFGLSDISEEVIKVSNST